MTWHITKIVYHKRVNKNVFNITIFAKLLWTSKAYNIINMTIVYINNSQHVSVKRTVTHKTKTGPKYWMNVSLITKWREFAWKYSEGWLNEQPWSLTQDVGNIFSSISQLLLAFSIVFFSPSAVLRPNKNRPVTQLRQSLNVVQFKCLVTAQRSYFKTI